MERNKQTEDFYYGEVAEAYDNERSHSPIWRKEDQIVEWLLTHLRLIGEMVLDVPVGTGRFLPLYQKLGYSSIGFDVSGDMLVQARARAGTKAQIARGDIRQLPLRTASLGLVVCIRFLHLIKRSTGRKAVAELSRVIKPGGFVIIGARLHGADSDPGWTSRIRTYVSRTKRIVLHWFGRSSSRSHSQRWLTKALQRKGFMIRSEHLVTRYKDGSRYLILLLEMTGVESSRKKRARSIELFGLPGVGKSTLFNALADDPTLAFSDGFALLKELSLWACLRRRPVASARLLIRLGPRWRELSQLPARKAVVAALRQLVAQKPRGDEMCLFQEGTSHEVWRQLIRHGDMSDLLISRLLPIADLTILIEAPVETLGDRLARKRHPGPISRDLLREPPTGPLWALATSAYTRVRAGIESSGGRTAVVVNQADMESGLERLTQILVDARNGQLP